MLASSLQHLKSRLFEWIGEDVEMSVDHYLFKRMIDTDIKFNQLPWSNNIIAITLNEDFIIVKNAKRTETINVPTRL